MSKFSSGCFCLHSELYNHYSKINLDFTLEVFPMLEEYDILIFDPSYNWVNRYNKRIDGTRWNKKAHSMCAYIFRHKSKAEQYIKNTRC